MAKVYFTEEIDLKNLNYVEKKETTSGPKMYRASYSGQNFNLQLRRVTVPFGVTNNEKFAKSADDYKNFLELSLDTSKEELAKFKKLLQDMDNHALEWLKTNSEKVLDSAFSLDDLKRLKVYTSMIKEKIDKTTKKKDSTYPDRLRVKLPFYKGNAPGFKVYKEVDGGKFEEVTGFTNETSIDLSWAQKGMEVVPIINFEGLWVINGKCFNSWRLMALKIFKGSSKAVTIDSFRGDDVGSSSPQKQITQASDEDEDNNDSAVIHDEEEDDDDEVVEEDD